MSKYKFVNLIDKLFVTVSIFLIIYAWVNFYLRDLWVTFGLSLIFTFACVFLLFYFVGKKQTKIYKNKKLNEDINTQFLVFKLTSKSKKQELLKQILEIDNQILPDEKHLMFIQNNQKHLVIIATAYDKLDNNILFNLLDEYGNVDADVFDIFCNDVANNILTNIYKNKKINFVTKNIIYENYFLKYNIYPDKTNINLNSTKLKFKEILKMFFVEKKAKSYFFCGLILIFSSIILPYHYYYIIVGSILLLFAIICKLLPKFN